MKQEYSKKTKETIAKSYRVEKHIKRFIQENKKFLRNLDDELFIAEAGLVAGKHIK